METAPRTPPSLPLHHPAMKHPLDKNTIPHVHVTSLSAYTPHPLLLSRSTVNTHYKADVVIVGPSSALAAVASTFEETMEQNATQITALSVP